MTDLKKPGERVLPGDPLAFAEEFLPGPGTFDDGTFLRAARLGTFEVDAKDMRAAVTPLTSVPSTVKVGDFVYGQITMLKPSMAGVEVLHVEGDERGVAGDTNGTLHVSKISNRYVQDVSREYRLGDIIRAGVVEVKPSIQLSTDHERCGAILCLCLRDRFPLKKAGKGLECPVCLKKDQRNLAPDYGQVFVPASVALRPSGASPALARRSPDRP